MRRLLVMLFSLAVSGAAVGLAPRGGTNRAPYATPARPGLVTALDANLSDWGLPSVPMRRRRGTAVEDALRRTGLPWMRSFREATAAARTSGRPILACFLSTDADRAPAVRLTGIFAEDWFATASRDVVLYVHLDARLPGDDDAAIARTLGAATLPYVVFVSATGEIVTPFRLETAGTLRDARLLRDRAVAAVRALRRNPADEASSATFGLIRGLRATALASVRGLDVTSRVPGVDPAVLAIYRRRRPELAARDHARRIDAVLHEYARSALHPAAAKPLCDGEIYDLYQAGVRIALDRRPTLHYCDALICGAMDRGDRTTALKYLPAARAACVRAVARYRAAAQRNPACRTIAERMIGYFEGKLDFLERRARGS